MQSSMQRGQPNNAGHLTCWFDCGTLSPENRSENVKTVLLLNKQTRQALAFGNEMLEALSPVIGPMVVPPLRWSNDERGGYRFGLRARFPLIRRIR